MADRDYRLPGVGRSASGVPAPVEITDKGYRIGPASYAVSRLAWSARAVVSRLTEEGWSRQAPLYSTSAAKCLTRDEADRHALDVARA
jgi:hypothetical protein